MTGAREWWLALVDGREPEPVAVHRDVGEHEDPPRPWGAERVGHEGLLWPERVVLLERIGPPAVAARNPDGLDPMDDPAYATEMWRQVSELRRRVGLANGPAEVVSNGAVMSGDPCVAGTRVPALTIVAYLRAGHSDREVYEDYPSLPPGAVAAVRRWAERTLGADWRGAPDGPDLARKPE